MFNSYKPHHMNGVCAYVCSCMCMSMFVLVCVCVASVYGYRYFVSVFACLFLRGKQNVLVYCRSGYRSKIAHDEILDVSLISLSHLAPFKDDGVCSSVCEFMFFSMRCECRLCAVVAKQQKNQPCVAVTEV